MKIGVFDSGVGGLSVARALERALPEHQVLYRNDAAHVPYGDRSPGELSGLVVPVLQSLVDDGCQLIVIACNTVTTTIIAELRAAFPVPLVAVEPMLKPAARHTTSGIIAVCATPATLASRRYAELKRMYAGGLTVLEPDCSQWSYLIEQERADEIEIDATVAACLDSGVDVIVLGCTHYHWIEDRIQAAAAGRAAVLQPEAAIVRRVRQMIDGDQEATV